MKHSLTLLYWVGLCVLAGGVSACSGGPETTSTGAPKPVTDSVPAPMPVVEAEDPFEEFEVESNEDAPPPETVSGGVISIDPSARIPKFLSEYNLFTDPAKQIPNAGLIPYALNTENYADGATVQRFIWMPPGAKATYEPTGVFDFSVGTALLQSFSYPAADRQDLVETRLLLKQADESWTLSAYKWDEMDTHAKKAVAGSLVSVDYIDEAGTPHGFDYLIPNKNDCKRCHEQEEEVIPIGLTARNLNRMIDYGDGPVEQLQHWIDSGLLEGAPEEPASIPRGPRWNDPETGTVTERARMWIDVNCAHCHNPKGAGAVSGLDLSITQESPIRYGVYKPPVAAGRSSEGLRFSIDPGSPDTSFLIRRLLSTDPSVMMPPLGRMKANNEAAELVSQWIGTMRFEEEAAKQMIAEQEEAFKALQEQAVAEAAKAGDSGQ